MNMENCVSAQQKHTICNLIAKQQRKKCATENPELFKKRENDDEFWMNVANRIIDNLIQKGYCEGYELESRGLIQGRGFNLEFDDNFNKEKYYIYTDGSLSNAMDYVPEKGIDLDGFQIFLIIMIAIYLIAFFITLITGSAAMLIVIALGIINLIILFNS